MHLPRRCTFFPNVLLGTENPVAGVAQTGDNVGVLVELLINGGQEDFHVGVGFLNGLDALGAAGTSS